MRGWSEGNLLETKQEEPNTDLDSPGDDKHTLFESDHNLRAENAIGNINWISENLSFHFLGIQVGLEASRDIDQNQESSVADLFMVISWS